MSNITTDEIKLYLDAARAEAKASATEVARSQAELRAELKLGMADISVDVHTAVAAHTKWIAAMGFGVIASCAAIIGLFKSASPPPPPASQPLAPYVIYTHPSALAIQNAPTLSPTEAPAENDPR